MFVISEFIDTFLVESNLFVIGISDEDLLASLMQKDRFAQYLSQLSEILDCKVPLLFVLADISKKWNFKGEDIRCFVREAQLYSRGTPFEFLTCETAILKTDEIWAQFRAQEWVDSCFDRIALARISVEKTIELSAMSM